MLRTTIRLNKIVKSYLLIWNKIIIITTIFVAVCLNISWAQGQQEKIDSLLKVLKTAGEDSSKVNSLNSLSTQLWQIGDYDRAKRYADDALTLSQKINYKKGKATAYNNIGVIYDYQGHYSEALDNYFISLKINEEINNKKGRAGCFSNIALIYDEQGLYPDALKNHYASLKIFEEIGDKKGIARTYNNIGLIYKNQGDYDEALKNYFASLKTKQEIGDKMGISVSYNNIGNTYALQENYPEALKNYLASLKLKLEIGDKNGIASSYGNLAIVNYKQGNYPDALKNDFASLKIFEEIGYRQGIAGSFSNIGMVYMKLNQFSEAKKYLDDGLSLSNEIGFKELIINAYEGLTLWDSTTGNYKKAFEHYKMYTLYRDSLFNEENTKKTVQSQMQYDFDKKEAVTKAEQDKKDAVAAAEIKRQALIKNSTLGGIGMVGIFSFFLIVSFNRRRKTSFEKQVAEVEMKALRSQMNPHFIFNSLHSINNYMMDNDKKNASDYLGKFSKLMRMILENSREREVSLEEDLSALELYMQLESMRFENKFTYKIEVADDIDKENTLVPPLILQPFVENSIFHGLQHKGGEGKILIRVQKENNMIICTVEDNGVGRHKAMEMKEKTAAHKGESLGMKITNARIDIINKIKKAKASVSLTDLTEGMRVEVKLPLVLAF